MFIKLGDLLLLGFLEVRLRVLALENDGQFGGGFLLPFRHEIRVKLMVGRALGDGPGFFKCFEDDLVVS